MKPYCFVLMPFGAKPDENGRSIPFDTIYSRIIKPAVEAAGMEPIRADEESVGGIIHKPMFERLMICDYAVADLTSANANVFYELGIRHGVRPQSTIPVFANGSRLPFDVALLRALPYRLDKDGVPNAVDQDRQALTERLNACRQATVDSPVYQLLTELPHPDIKRLKTDTFRDQVEHSKEFRERLAKAREAAEGKQLLHRIESELVIEDADAAVVIDLLLSYRALKDWQGMVALVSKMSGPLAHTVMVQEQLGFALNRLAMHSEAERVLKNVLATHGSSTETNGLLGRVYKDQWEQAKQARSPAASGYLIKAIECYLQGFESDWRDAYPGINAVTLMEMTEPPDSRQQELIPVVQYAVKRRIASKQPDYWDYATLLELAVLAGNAAAANGWLGDALANVREAWEPESTARNIQLIREVRESRGAEVGWIQHIEAGLTQRRQGR